MANVAESAENPSSDEIKIRRVPDSLVEFLRSRIVQYLEKTENLSAEIHEIPGQSAKLVLRGGESDVLHPAEGDRTAGQNDNRKTNTILVSKIPSTVDEEILEVYFESHKKGGGPVSNIKLNRQKNWAIIEFLEADAVDRVVSKTPVKLMGTELDICPYTPLVQDNSLIQSLDFCTIHEDLTGDLLALHVEEVIGHGEISSTEYISDDETEEDEKLDKYRDENLQTQKKVEGSLEHRNAVKQTITWLRPVQLRMLQATNYFEESSKEFPDIKVNISLERKEITCEGDIERVNYCKLKLLETVGRLGLSIVCDIPEKHKQLYQKERVIKYINDRLKTQDCKCEWEWEVEGQMLTVCCYEADISKCIAVIKGAITETRFQISKESSATFFSAGWQEELKKIQKDYDLLYHVISDQQEQTEVCVITNTTLTDAAVSRVQKFLKQQLKISTDSFTSFDDDFPKYRSLYNLSTDVAHKVLDLIIEDVSLQYDIAVTKQSISYYYKYSLTGTPAGREVIKNRIKTLKLKSFW